MIYESAQIQAFAAEVLAMSEAAETQLSFGGGALTVARLTDNIIQTGSTQRWLELAVRVAFGRRGSWRYGTARSNRLATADVERLVQWAGEAALVGDVRNDYTPVPQPANFEHTPDLSDAYDLSTANAGPAFRANELARVALPCRRLGYRSFGHYAISEGSLALDGSTGLIAVANSEGLFQFHLPTTATFSAIVETPHGGVGRAEAVGHLAHALDTATAAEQAILDAERPVAEAYPLGTFPVVLDAPAVARLLTGLAPHLTYAFARTGRSVLGRAPGDRAASDAITLRADASDARLRERPFDLDGWPRHPITVVEAGIVRELLHDRAEAEAAGIEPSGYSDVTGIGVVPDHLILEGNAGGGSVDELIAEAGDGVLIRDIIGPVQFERPGLFARGVVPTGAFRIERGRIGAALRNVYFELELTTFLRDLSRLGEARRVGSFVAPPILGEGLYLYEGRA